jgi:hypothetical protein
MPRFSSLTSQILLRSTPYSVAAPVGYSLVSGTKAPTLGSGGQSPFPASNWSSLSGSGSADDGYTTVPLPFSFNFNNSSYSTFYPGSNAYITFGSGSTQYSSLGPSAPALDKIMIAGADNSFQRMSYTTDAVSNRWVRYRQEGAATTSGTAGSPTLVWEATFFSQTFTGGFPVVELLIGTQARSSGVSGIYSASALLTGGTIASNTGVAANQSYVLVGNAAGTSWTVYTGYYVGGTNY